MSADTQWPRYYVFEKPDERAEFLHAGSVHAPDDEMALLIARDVFARRPERVAMWVARADRLHTWTKEQVTGAPAEGLSDEADAPTELYQVFTKVNQKGVCIHRGQLQAAGPSQALAAARQQFPKPPVLVWWLIRDSDVLKSGAADREVLFESSPGKAFRHESEYHVQTMMREVRRKKDEASR